MSDNVAQIKERLNVVDVISGYIKVQKSGINFKARCPFHNEKTPSFYISPERQIWHCFGCSLGGDLISFVKQIEGVEFPEALKILAQKAGIQLEAFGPAEKNLKDSKAVLYDICEIATRFFEKQLHQSQVGKRALGYLKDRKMNDKTIKEFRLGFAPDSWQSLGNFLCQYGFHDKDVLDAGLVVKKQNQNNLQSSFYDRFRSRIIFPVFDINDRVIGFSGRVFDARIQAQTDTQTDAENVSDGQQESVVAKYINTPQTAIYDKSRVLYGLNKAKMDIRRSDRCLLVEGNIDVIMSYQAGVKNVAATSGTALTPSHLQLLQRYTKNLDFCFDTDQAGLIATRKGIGLALSQSFNIKVVSIPDLECKDPADYVKKVGDNPIPGGNGASWQEVTKTSKPIIDFYFDKLRSEVDFSAVEGKKAIIASLGPFIKRVASHIERSHWITKLATLMKVREESVEADIQSVKDDLESYENRAESEPAPQENRTIQDTHENQFDQIILAVILRKPTLFKKALESFEVNYLDSDTKEILSRLRDSNLQDFSLDRFTKEFESQLAMKIEFANIKSQEMFGDFSDQELELEFNKLIDRVRQKDLAVKLLNIEFDIKEAEAANNREQLTMLISKFNDLTKTLN